MSAIHCPSLAQEGGALIKLKLGCKVLDRRVEFDCAKIAAMTSRPSVGPARIAQLNTTFSASNSLTWSVSGYRIPSSLRKRCVCESSWALSLIVGERLFLRQSGRRRITLFCFRPGNLRDLGKVGLPRGRSLFSSGRGLQRDGDRPPNGCLPTIFIDRSQGERLFPIVEMGSSLGCMVRRRRSQRADSLHRALWAHDVGCVIADLLRRINLGSDQDSLSHPNRNS